MKISIFIKTTAILVTTVLCISAAQAATSGTPGVGGADAFNSVWTTVKSWTQGTLGKVMALVMILVGIAAGIARQSLNGLCSRSWFWYRALLSSISYRVDYGCFITSRYFSKCSTIWLLALITILSLVMN